MQVRRTAEKLLKNSMKARLLREEEITKSLRSDSERSRAIDVSQRIKYGGEWSHEIIKRT